MAIGSPSSMKREIERIRNEATTIEGAVPSDESEPVGRYVSDLAMMVRLLCNVVEWQQERITRLSVEVLG